MNNIFINGSIEITNKTLFKVLKEVDEIETSKLKLEENFKGYEIVYKDDDIYVYAHGNEEEKENETIIFDCEYKKSIEEAHVFVNKLKDALNDQNIPYFSFEYGEGDGDGNDIGEQFEVSFQV